MKRVGRYELLHEVTESSPHHCCTTYVARSDDRGGMCSLRIFPLAALRSNHEERLRLEREIVCLRLLPHHVNIQKLLEVFVTCCGELVVAVEFCPGGELFDALESFNHNRDGEGEGSGMPLHVAKRMFLEMLRAVDHLHRHGLVHRDLKLEHVLLDDQNHVKLSFFGFAAAFEMKRDISGGASTRRLRVHCGSRNYAPPEIVLGLADYDAVKAEMWTAGVVGYALLTGSLPFVDASTDDGPQEDNDVVAAATFLERIQHPHDALGCSSMFQTQVGEAGKQLILSLLNVDPRLRVSAAEALKHRFFNTT